MQITKTALVMNFTAIFLLAAVVQVSASGNAQTVTYSARSVPLQKVFSVIKQQTGYLFFYDEQDLKGIENVSVSLHAATIETALQQVLQDQPLDFAITGNTVVVNRKMARERKRSFSELLETPPITINGRVVNEKGEPVIGASVRVRGTNTGTTTNDNGEFVLNDVDENATLQISSVNIEPFEINVSGKRELNLIAKMRVSEAEAVTVVNTGYQKLSPERTTGSFSVINKELVNRRVSTGILDRIENLVPGVQFNLAGHRLWAMTKYS